MHWSIFRISNNQLCYCYKYSRLSQIGAQLKIRPPPFVLLYL